MLKVQAKYAPPPADIIGKHDWQEVIARISAIPVGTQHFRASKRVCIGVE
jgi:hypothetical protein